jgi:hypothetical protein
MAEDPNHPWGTGATRYRWTPEVSATVQLVLQRFSAVTANTYVCHPWCGWADVSVDYWGAAGRGDPLPRHLGPQIRKFLFDLKGKPFIRHSIWEHQLWTSWGGYSPWVRDDHTGDLRHLHVTYWQG